MLPKKVSALRDRHSCLHYRAYTVDLSHSQLTMRYTFELEPGIVFTPTITIPSRRGVIDGTCRRLAFLIGIVELLSYWKTSCPERISIECGSLTEDEIAWWENLVRNGLGEFFFVNGITPAISFSIQALGSEKFDSSGDLSPLRAGSSLILVGGGKDSVVSLELMRATNGENAALCVNPIKASRDAIEAAQYTAPLVVSRTLDAQLRELNNNGYLNGHTPYSALLAFVSVLSAYQNGFSRVIASNESSASEGNIQFLGFNINHQYSKSLAFESTFREYMRSLDVPIEYFSLLRPLNELQICALFSQFPQHHSLFRSCNREQTMAARERQDGGTAGRRRGWCGECPKCVFTYICLSCFLDLEAVDKIFGESPLSGAAFMDIARDLAGYGDHKPFECVGTYEEVRSALETLRAKLIQRGEGKRAEGLARISQKPLPLAAMLDIWNDEHFLTPELSSLLRERLERRAAAQ